ncbi:hypothetical protein AAFF_G00049830 [Aldrovandia affinis]|uniref:Uncharacterized protein n=1 Tax=Aldrovandia affinis TaxID=143900 RepID=A0AAD7S1G0_9TELE|nr:hypothetical protein AAFF_G00049830 [Aldrovandia affinis]
MESRISRHGTERTSHRWVLDAGVLLTHAAPAPRRLWGVCPVDVGGKRLRCLSQGAAERLHPGITSHRRRHSTKAPLQSVTEGSRQVNGAGLGSYLVTPPQSWKELAQALSGHPGLGCAKKTTPPALPRHKGGPMCAGFTATPRGPAYPVCWWSQPIVRIAAR